ncbi:hypothetical protein RchiOBHm_Chr7g0218691 [Rosa chinensis]|uniref:Uncharacterized protein n=1 Tax=Rosa chinensis TaxID=74649 RepID=A0A2P6PCB7_ROSCH|nr:hypothetical protein RchiOBHm_Chr7g0218691 [Rosa chinensis]
MQSCLKQKCRNQNVCTIFQYLQFVLFVRTDEMPFRLPHHECLVITFANCCYVTGKQQPDSFRTEPYLFDTDGHAYWKLKGYNDGDNVLLQDMGTGDPFVSSDEQWFSYGAETKEAAENYYSSTRY